MATTAATALADLELFDFHTTTGHAEHQMVTFIVGRPAEDGRPADVKILVRASIDRLTCLSSVFKTMFKDAWWKDRTTDITTIDHEPNAFLRFMKLLHNQKIEPSLIPKRIWELAEIIDFYDCAEPLHYAVNSILTSIKTDELLFGEIDSALPWADFPLINAPASEDDETRQSEADTTTDETDSRWGSLIDWSHDGHITQKVKQESIELWTASAFLLRQPECFEFFTKQAVLHWQGWIEFTTTQCKDLVEHLERKYSGIVHIVHTND